MYVNNQEIANLLLEKFGIEKTILYCIMESEKNAVIYEMHKTSSILPYEDYADFDFDSQWWLNQADELKQIEYHERNKTKADA